MKRRCGLLNITTNCPLRRASMCAFVLDPMLATGGSAVATVDILKRWGVSRIKFVGLIGAPEGITALTEAHPDVPIISPRRTNA